jgi:uncharacterized protein
VRFYMSEVERTNEVHLCETMAMPQIRDECGQIDSIGAVRAEVDVVKDIGVYRARGRIAADVVYNCSRCLATYTATLAASLDESFTNRVDRAEKGVHLVEGDVVVLDSLLEQELFLAVEYRPLCSPDCKGLCPECGCNRNELPCSCNTEKLDPRFSLLKDLHFEADSE